MTDFKSEIETFLKSPSYAVVGASSNPEKYGHKCFACYLQKGKDVYPIHPKETNILGHKVYPNLSMLPKKVDAISIITPPIASEQVIDEAIAAGIKNIWLQPGAENQACIEKCKKAGLNVIYGGPCILVELGYHES